MHMQNDSPVLVSISCLVAPPFKIEARARGNPAPPGSGSFDDGKLDALAHDGRGERSLASPGFSGERRPRRDGRSQEPDRYGRVSPQLWTCRAQRRRGIAV